jgi:hypothetical protein
MLMLMLKCCERKKHCFIAENELKRKRAVDNLLARPGHALLRRNLVVKFHATIGFGALSLTGCCSASAQIASSHFKTCTVRALTKELLKHQQPSPVCLSYNPYFSAYFFNQNSIFFLPTNQRTILSATTFQRNERPQPQYCCVVLALYSVVPIVNHGHGK